MFLAPDRESFDSLHHALLQTDDIPEFVPGQHDSEEDILRKLQEELELGEVSPPMGQRKNGMPDMRFRENRRALGLQNKDGLPDMRFKINKEIFGNKVSVASSQTSNPAPRSSYTAGPVKKDGTTDMRYAVNKLSSGYSSRWSNYSSRSSSRGSVLGSGSCGPLKSDGTPDMRYAANRSAYSSSDTSYSSRSSSSSRGPLKKDGTPDVRFKANQR